MAYSGTTTNYKLPQYAVTDKAVWQDNSQAYEIIDTQMKANADAAQDAKDKSGQAVLNVQQALDNANQALSVANTASETATAANAKAQSAVNTANTANVNATNAKDTAEGLQENIDGKAEKVMHSRLRLPISQALL